MVEKVDISDGLLIMDNGHKISTNNIPTQPSVGDTLEYVKTLGYSLDPRGTPKLNDKPAFINIEIIDQ